MTSLLPWAGALAIGLALGLLGSGGSILTVPILVYGLGQPEKVAIAGSLAIVGGIATIGAALASLERRVDARTVVLFGVPGMLGAILGTALASQLAGSTQLALFAVVMLLAAASMLRTPARAPTSADSPPPRRSLGRLALDGLAVGTMTGLVGVGGGFLIVPALVVVGGMPVHLAIGTSLAIIALNAWTGFVRHLGGLAGAGLALDPRVILVFIAVGGIGATVGSRLAGRLPAARLRRGFAWFLLALGVFVAWRTLGR
jgi:uncharacterized membrane protein YfcA